MYLFGDVIDKEPPELPWRDVPMGEILQAGDEVYHTGPDGRYTWSPINNVWIGQPPISAGFRTRRPPPVAVVNCVRCGNPYSSFAHSCAPPPAPSEPTAPTQCDECGLPLAPDGCHLSHNEEDSLSCVHCSVVKERDRLKEEVVHLKANNRYQRGYHDGEDAVRRMLAETTAALDAAHSRIHYIDDHKDCVFCDSKRQPPGGDDPMCRLCALEANAIAPVAHSQSAVGFKPSDLAIIGRECHACHGNGVVVGEQSAAACGECGLPLAPDGFPPGPDGEESMCCYHCAVVRERDHLNQQINILHRRIAENPPPSPSAACGWRPIESAPRDGTVILLGNEYGTWYGRYYPVYPSGYKPENPWFSLMINHCHMDRATITPTHWQPRPPAPDAERVSVREEVR